MNKPKYVDNGVPVFTRDSFFRPDEKVFIHMSTDCPDFVGVKHKHKFIEIVYVISGKATHMIEEKSYNVVKGDLVIINYDTPHAFYEKKNDHEQFIAYDLMFTPDFLDASLIQSKYLNDLGSSFLFYSLFPEEQKLGPDLHLSSYSYSMFGELFGKIYLEYIGADEGYVELIRAYVIELIIKAFRKMNVSDDRKISTDQMELVDTVLSYLRENYNTHITLEELAAQTFLSKDYFSRLFREITGSPVGQFLQQIRIDEACKLLMTTNRTVNDIASECGFNDIKYFYNTFRKRKNMTPGEYRANVESR